MPQISSGILVRAGHQGRFAINLPSIHAVYRARGAKMRQSAPVFDATQQQRGSILQQGRARIEHAVDGIRPMLTGQDRVAGMPQKQWRVVIAFDIRKRCFGSSHESSSAFSDFCRERISNSAIRNDKRGFRSLILIGAVGMQAVPATAGFRIVERKLQIVIAQEPVESRPGLSAPAIVSRSRDRPVNKRTPRRRLQWVADRTEPVHSPSAIKPLRADRHKVAVHRATLRFHKPIQRIESGGNHAFVPASRPHEQHGLGQSRVPVRHNILKPLPVRTLD